MSKKLVTSPVHNAPSKHVSEEERLKAIEIERGIVYGPPREFMRNLGFAWTSIIQQHYGITLPHTIPDHVSALMLTSFKVLRSTRAHKSDNYDDGHNYLSFADRFQQGKE